MDKTVSPLKAVLVRREELVVDNPFRGAGQRASELRTELLPPNTTTKGISIAAHFDSARLSDDNMKRLRRESERDPQKKPPPTEGLQQVDYTTDEPPEDPETERPTMPVDTDHPCSAAIALTQADDTKPLKELHFFQPTDPSVGDRTLEITPVGADLLVKFSVVDPTHPPVMSDPARKVFRPGCSKTVSLGEWDRSFTGPAQLEVVVPSGQSFQIWFSPLPNQNLWPGAGDFYEPFNLVTIPPVSASGLSTLIQGGSPSTLPLLKASSLAREQPLLLTHLRIGAEELQLDVSGKAMVQKEGKDIITFDLWTWMKSNPLIAILLSGFEVGLVNWVRLSFKKSSARSGAT